MTAWETLAIMVERVQMELLDTLALAHLDLLGMIASTVCIDIQFNQVVVSFHSG